VLLPKLVQIALMSSRVLASLMTKVLLSVGLSIKAKVVKRKQRMADARKACTCVSSANATITAS
jgi:Ca2+/H+ antiporter